MANFEFFTVGGFTCSIRHAGAEIGREFASYDEAKEYFDFMKHRLASIELYGWTQDDCELLESYCV